MKRILIVCLVVGLLGIAGSRTVFAIASGPPSADTWVNINAPTNSYGTEDNLWTRGDTESCNTARRTYLKWDLTDVPNTPGIVSSATLTLFVNGSTGDFTAARSVTLFKVANDSWDNNTTWNTSPAVGDPIQTLNVSHPSGSISNTPIVFSNAALASYVDAEANGDDVVSFAVVMTGNCTAGSVGLRFDSVDQVGGVAPDLQLLGPNAVTLRTFGSNNPTVSPLILGGVALLLAGVAGIVVARRRRLAN